MARILIAGTPAGITTLEHILGQGHEVNAVSAMSNALAKLNEQAFDLIMIDVHFDQSRMFDLLRDVHKIPENADKPIICFCTQDTHQTRLMHESTNVASRALGAWMYLDWHKFEASEDPDAELRRIIERCLTDEARKETQASRLDIHKRREELLRLRQTLEGKEWSVDLEDRVADFRERLAEVLLELSELQIESIAQQEIIAESKKLEDRVSVPVTLTEDAMGLEETQIGLQESKQLGKEQEIIPHEEAKAKAGRRKLTSKEGKKKPASGQ